MDADTDKISWSRRVSSSKIRRLYESDARGMLDEELLDDVGYGIFARCQDIIEASEAGKGTVKCRNCGSIIVRQEGEKKSFVGHGVVLVGGELEELKCDRCSWQTTWGEYVKSCSVENLIDGGAVHVFESFVRKWPSARSPGAKLVLIDTLIHEFHVIQDGFGGPIGTSVIQGTAKDVNELIDRLAYGTGSTPGLQETRQLWLSRLREKQRWLPKSELYRIARELGVKGASRMRREELKAAIDRIDPKRIELAQDAKESRTRSGRRHHVQACSVYNYLQPISGQLGRGGNNAVAANICPLQDRHY